MSRFGFGWVGSAAREARNQLRERADARMQHYLACMHAYHHRTALRCSSGLAGVVSNPAIGRSQDATPRTHTSHHTIPPQNSRLLQHPRFLITDIYMGRFLPPKKQQPFAAHQSPNAVIVIVRIGFAAPQYRSTARLRPKIRCPLKEKLTRPRITATPSSSRTSSSKAQVLQPSPSKASSPGYDMTKGGGSRTRVPSGRRSEYTKTPARCCVS